MFRGRFLDKAPSKVLVILKKNCLKNSGYLIGNLFACCKSVKFILISSFNPMLYTINPLIYTTWIHLYTTLILHIYNINIWFFDQQYTTTYSWFSKSTTTIYNILQQQHTTTTFHTYMYNNIQPSYMILWSTMNWHNSSFISSKWALE